MGGFVPHIPVLGPQAVDFLNVRDGGIYIDATFGAGGYTRAILAAANCHVIGIDRDRSAIALGADLVAASGERLALAEGPLRRSRRDRTRLRLRDSRRRRARSRRLLHAARHRRARLLVPPRRAARHAHGRAGRERRRCRQRGGRARSRQHHFHSRRGASLARRRPRHRQGARRRADHDHARARRYRRLGGAFAPGRYPSGHAHVPGAAHFRQRRTRRAGRGLAAAERMLKPAGPAGRGVVPFARGPHRQDRSSPPAASRAPARVMRRNSNAPRRPSMR